MSKERYIPIDEANTEKVVFEMPFPDYVDRERVGVNISKLERLCSLGGITSLAVIGETDGEVSRETPEIAGFSNRGEAVATKKTSKRIIDLHDHNILHLGFPEEGLSSFAFSVANLRININEAVNRAIEEKKGKASVRDTETWTKYLDVALKQGVKQIGVHNLIGHGKLAAVTKNALLIGFFISIDAIAAHRADFYELGRGLLMAQQIWNIGEFVHGKLHGLEDYRWSMVNGIQPDRALAITFLANRGNLIKTLPKEK